MSNITYTNKNNAGSGIVKQWRDVDANEVKTVVNTKADAWAAFTTHTGNTWDGTPKNRTLTGNLALTLTSSYRSCPIRIQQDGTGGRTLTINGFSVPIASGANNVTYVTAVYNDVIAGYDIEYDTNIVGNVGGGGDVTAPTVTSVTVQNATPTKWDILFNEALDTSGSTAGTGDFSVKINAISQTVTGVSFSGSTVQLTVNPAVANGDVCLVSFVGGANKIQDVAGNDAASFTDHAVTNNVAGGGAVTFDTLPWFTYYKVATLGTTANQTTHNSGGSDFFDRLIDISGNHSTPSAYDLTHTGSPQDPKYGTFIESVPSMEVDSPSGNQIYNNAAFSPLLSFPLTRAAVVRFPTIPTLNKYFLYNVSGTALMDVGILGASSGNMFVYAGGGIIDTGFAPAANTTYLVWVERDLDKTTRVYVNNSLKTTVADTGGTQYAGNKLGDAANGCKFYYSRGGIINSVVSSSDRTAAYNDLKTIFTSLP